jgi:hypothetical protein
MSTIQGYVDDSGDEHDPQHGAMSVAGYLGSADCWAEFNTDWLKALQVFGVNHLHMRELKKRIGQFKSWSPDDEREAALLGTLANVIGKAKLKGFGAVVALPDLREQSIPGATPPSVGALRFAQVEDAIVQSLASIVGSGRVRGPAGACVRRAASISFAAS